MGILFSVIPVLVFLSFLFVLDSFKLVFKSFLLLSIVWGISAALFLYFIKVSNPVAAPLIEEVLKSVFVLYLIKRNKVGFTVDAAIYGFASGAGFALVENLVYFYAMPEASILTWIVRGFGTAVMHGGCTAIIGMLVIFSKSVEKRGGLYIVSAFAAAFLIHYAFNHFYINPVLQTLGIIIILSVIFVLIFRYSEKKLHNWLEMEFSTEIDLLNMINRGEMLSTRAGQYLGTLKTNFSSESILDMYCYIRLYLELSIKAKRNLMLRENDFPVIIEEDIDEKLAELKALRKSIGKVGELTLAPLMSLNYRDLWKLNLLK
ncbi:MAG: PrsW family intramembrane metalloprotease [Bacteroidales bacterium]|nr:PrsW family intramembrane metalloprotease [Bacteroidales bacterium]